jgi:hypothetical protein
MMGSKMRERSFQRNATQRTLGVAALTLPARAREPWTLPIFFIVLLCSCFFFFLRFRT